MALRCPSCFGARWLACSPATSGRNRAQVYAHALLSLWTGTRNNYVALFDMDEYMAIDPRGKRIEDLSRECWLDYAEIHLHRQVPRSSHKLTRTCRVCQRSVNKPNAAHASTGDVCDHFPDKELPWNSGLGPCLQGTTCEDNEEGCSVAKNPGRWFNVTEGLTHPIQKFTQISGGTGMLKVSCYQHRSRPYAIVNSKHSVVSRAKPAAAR